MRREDSPPIYFASQFVLASANCSSIQKMRPFVTGASNAWGQEFPARGKCAIDIQLNGEALIGFSRASAIRMATPVTRPTIVTSPG